MDIKKLLPLFLLIPFFILAAILPAAATGWHGTLQQNPPNKDALFVAGNVSSGCIAQVIGAHDWKTLNDNKELPVFQAAHAKYPNVPLAFLIAVAQQESHFVPSARSSAGAAGVMQIMPSTWPGNNTDYKTTNHFDIQANIFTGAHLYSTLINQNKGDLRLALAGYNAGQGNVNKYHGIPPFAETIGYVNSIMPNYNKLIGCSTPGGDNPTNPVLTVGTVDFTKDPPGTSSEGSAVLAAARTYQPGDNSNLNCTQHVEAVYAVAHMKLVAVPNPTTAAPQPGYAMNMPSGLSSTGQHAIIFDHADGDMWYFWSGDAKLSWKPTTGPYVRGSQSQTMPYNPTIEGRPTAMWRPATE